MSEVGVQRDGVESALPIDRPSGRRRGDRVVGAGRATQEVIELAMAAARSERPVLITGPQGSGKDHLARAIHTWSGRSSGPYVVLSTAVVPEGTIARELFGIAGAQDGALDRAAGGTLLLDGVERLVESVRTLLARAIGEGRYQRELESTPTALRTRVIATGAKHPDRSPFGEAPHHPIRILPLAERP